MPNLVALGQTVWVLLGGPKHFGDPGAPPLGMRTVGPLAAVWHSSQDIQLQQPAVLLTVSWAAWACGKPCVSDSQR